jgi:hypothetical protein
MQLADFVAETPKSGPAFKANLAQLASTSVKGANINACATLTRE